MGRLAVAAGITVVLTSAACRQLFGFETPVGIDASAGDGPMPDDPGGAFCVGAELVGQLCFPSAPQGLLELSGTVNTDDSPLCVFDEFCVIAADQITVDGTSVTGTRPLVLVATTKISVVGTLDASSHRGGPSGPNANESCGLIGLPGTDGGGAGGSFADLGGNGGNGLSTPGGVASSPVLASTLRGGCAGQSGGGANAGVGGSSGGAIYLLADTIDVSGTVTANGAGGSGGNTGSSGGGGGGSGGMIGFEATNVIVTGVVMANGAGGGEGCGTTSLGNPGADPIPQFPTQAALGGSGGSGGGGEGGNGGVNNGQATAGNAGGGGAGAGGGGGGSVGVIRIFAESNIASGIITPPPS